MGFVGRRTKAEDVPLLKSEAGVSVTGKLGVLQRHYQQVGKLSLDSNNDASGRKRYE